MLKIPSKLSINLSLILSVFFFVGCIFGILVLPWYTEGLISIHGSIADKASLTEAGKIIVKALVYSVIAVFLITDLLLFALLLRVKKGKVFSDKSVALIRSVSWCCFLLCFICSLLGCYYYTAFVISFISVFLGICIRVVKNVIEEATQIKSENDLTV